MEPWQGCGMDMARRLCAYCGSEILASQIRWANNNLELMTAAQRRCAELLLAREPHWRLDTDLGTNADMQLVLTCLSHDAQLLVCMQSGLPSSAIRDRLAGCLAVREEDVALLCEGREIGYDEILHRPRKRRWRDCSGVAVVEICVVVDAAALVMSKDGFLCGLEYIRARVAAWSRVSILRAELLTRRCLQVCVVAYLVGS